MKTIYDYIKVKNNSTIREYKIYYYKDVYENIDRSKILKLVIDINANKINLDDHEFLSFNKLKNYFDEVATIGKISSYNIQDISNLIEKFNANIDAYDGIEIILPYYDEPYEEQDIKNIYNLFVKKLHIEIK